MALPEPKPQSLLRHRTSNFQVVIHKHWACSRTALTETLNTKMLSRIQIVLMIRQINQITRRLARTLKESLGQCWCSVIKKIKTHFTCLRDAFIYAAARPPYLTPTCKWTKSTSSLLNKVKSWWSLSGVLGLFWYIYGSAKNANWKKIILRSIDPLNRLCNAHTFSSLLGGRWGMMLSTPI